MKGDRIMISKTDADQILEYAKVSEITVATVDTLLGRQSWGVGSYVGDGRELAKLTALIQISYSPAVFQLKDHQ